MIPNPVILGIETSCDETGAAIVEGGARVLSNVVATQDELHEEFAGVVPEIASRAHLERILPVVNRALSDASLKLSDLDAIAVGHRPGLIGSLLVGVSAAKALSWSLGLPLIGVDHVISHLSACTLDGEEIAFPALGLVISGGHTSLYLMHSPTDIKLLGKTIDDAAGEAFDKGATILDIGYPGGPAIDRLSKEGNEKAHTFPVANLGKDSLDFSFSGVKTSLLYAVRGMPKGRGLESRFEKSAADLTEKEKADYAASLQLAIVKALTRNMERALDKHEVKSIVAGGGVTANSKLRTELQILADKHNLELRLPGVQYCTDNAAMIAGYAAHRFCVGDFDDLSLAAATSSVVV